MLEPWQKLFRKALEQLYQGNISAKNWIFGGGTVLMHKYNHRESKDVDIFFYDRQFLAYISPRVNDGVETSLMDYSEQANHTRLSFAEGEIDFILASPLTKVSPSFTKVMDVFVYVEHPVEIIAKKIHYRCDEFKPRDIFDLAVVYDRQRDYMLKNIGAIVEKIPNLTQRIDMLAKAGELEEALSRLSILPGGEKIRGHELALCKHFLQAVEKNIENGYYQCKQRGMER